MGCCVPGPEGPADEGALLSQLCSVLKDYEGLEEIDKMLGIPTLAGQVGLQGPGTRALSGPRSLRTKRCISMSAVCLCLQAPLPDQDQYLGSPDPPMKPLMYSQHYGAQPGYGCVPPDGGFQSASISSHMGGMRMPHAGYPPMMRMPGNAGPRAVGMRAVGSNPAVPPQPNNLRLQLQHRLQAQLVGKPVNRCEGGEDEVAASATFRWGCWCSFTGGSVPYYCAFVNIPAVKVSGAAPPPPSLASRCD